MKIRLTKETMHREINQMAYLPGYEAAKIWRRLHDKASDQSAESLTEPELRLYEGLTAKFAFDANLLCAITYDSPEPSEEDRLREEIKALKAEIVRLLSTGATQNPSQGIERHMTAESHPDAPQGNTEPKYRMLETGEFIDTEDEFLVKGNIVMGKWEKTTSAGKQFNVGMWHYPHRRRLPDGW